MTKYQNANERTHRVMGRIMSVAHKDKERVADIEREREIAFLYITEDEMTFVS